MAEVPTRYAPMAARAASGRSRRSAIRLFCIRCVGWSEAAVRACGSTNCPLHPYRLADAPETRDDPPGDMGVRAS